MPVVSSNIGHNEEITKCAVSRRRMKSNVDRLLMKGKYLYQESS